MLGYERLARRIASLYTTIPELLAEYRSIVEIVPAVTILPTVIADPDDDHVLACAITANADLIVSGDKHLLDSNATPVVSKIPP